MFEKLDDHKPNWLLESKAEPSHARGGELWKPILEFKLQDETSDDDDIQFVKEALVEDIFIEAEDESEE